MKKTVKLTVFVLCAALCVAIGAIVLSCASSGGGGTGETVEGNWTWVGYSPANKDDGDTSVLTVVEADEVIGGATVHTYTLSGTVTSAIQYGLAECHITPDADTLQLLRTCKAISFKILGDGKRYNIEVPIPTVKDYAYHMQSITATEGEVVDANLAIKGFMQPSWTNNMVLFNPVHIEKIIFKTRNQSEGGLGDFSVKIWDFKLHM